MIMLAGVCGYWRVLGVSTVGVVGCCWVLVGVGAVDVPFYVDVDCRVDVAGSVLVLCW